MEKKSEGIQQSAFEIRSQARKVELEARKRRMRLIAMIGCIIAVVILLFVIFVVGFSDD